MRSVPDDASGPALALIPVRQLEGSGSTRNPHVAEFWTNAPSSKRLIHASGSTCCVRPRKLVSSVAAWAQVGEIALSRVSRWMDCGSQPALPIDCAKRNRPSGS
jgi:hypothetical protein